MALALNKGLFYCHLLFNFKLETNSLNEMKKWVNSLDSPKEYIELITFLLGQEDLIAEYKIPTAALPEYQRLIELIQQRLDQGTLQYDFTAKDFHRF